MIYRCTDAYYFHNLNTIGGVESHIYYLSKKYSDRDFCAVCHKGSDEQIARLRKNIRVIILDKEDRLECDTLFVAYNKGILSQCSARRVIFVIHSDYKALIKTGMFTEKAIAHDDRIDEILAVSKTAKQGWNDKDNVKVVYMPIILDPVEDPILLVSATRLSIEKGADRMRMLAEALDKAKVNYLWQIYTTKPEPINSKNVQFLAPRLDIADKMQIYDGLVQLSDCESYCISFQEALMRGVPIISTDLPILRQDMKVDDRYVIKLPFDMLNIDDQVERIRNIKKMKAAMPKYSPPKDRWDEYITETKSDYKTREVKVRATDGYKHKGITDRQLGYIPKPNEEWLVTMERYEELLSFERRTKTRLVELIEC